MSVKVKIFIIVLVFILVIGLLIFGLYILLSGQKTQNTDNVVVVFGEKNLLVEKISTTRSINYANFLLTRPENINGKTSKVLTKGLETLISKNQNAKNPGVKNIIIPSLEIYGDVIFSTNPNEDMKKGFALIPPSSKTGEKIFLCYREYFGQNHHNSCKYLDKVYIGSEVSVAFDDESISKYTITSINYFYDTDFSISTHSRDDIIKIITTTPLETATYRLVIIGRKINK